MNGQASETRTYHGGAGGGERAPQAPVRGRLARLLGPLHVTGVFWYRFHAFGARRAEWVMRLVLPLFTAFFWVALRRIRAAVAHNLVPVLGDCGWLQRQLRIWRTLHSFAWSLTERYERLEGGVPFDVQLENGEPWERLVACGEGFVLLTGHVGNWEMASAVPLVEGARKIHVVREQELDPRAQAYIEQRLRERMGAGYVTHFAGEDPRLGLAMREALERGEIVALQGDRPRRNGSSVTVPLFGRPYELPVGPLALARQTGCALLPVFVYRQGRRRYRVVLHEPLRVPRTRDRVRDVEQVARAFAPVLERAVRRGVHQWFVFRELWAEGPGGDSGLGEGGGAEGVRRGSGPEPPPAD